jgi:TRAP-type C4-dicarboxylate transport system substrate-binding protein
MTATTLTRRQALALTGAAIAAPAVVPGAARAQELVLRLHQFLPLNSSIPDQGIGAWIEAVQTASGGRIRVDHFPSMQLGGSPPSLYDQARDGVVDIVWTLLGYTPGRFPRSEAFELPFLNASAEATSRAFHRFATDQAAEEFAEIHPILFHVHGRGLLHSKGAPITRLEDMRGRKFRGPTRIVTGMLERLGATAVGMPVPAVPEALSKGVIDGVAIPWEVTMPLRIPELVDSHTEFAGDRGLYAATFVLAMNRDAYSFMDGELRDVIDAHSGVEWAGRFGRVMDTVDQEGRALAVAAGNPVLVLDEAETARWREASAGVAEDWAAEMTARGLDGPALAQAARDLVAEEIAR